MSGTKSQDRSDRLKAALRENLRRRKLQARGREAERPAGDSPAEAGRDPREPSKD
jgi:hypothetical protein